MEPQRPSIALALSTALLNTPADDRDGSLVALSMGYAMAIDEAEKRDAALSDLGPKLLQALTALGMTPAARAAIAKGGDPSGGRSAAEDALARLRARRAAR